jgi:hypothetical protein
MQPVRFRSLAMALLVGVGASASAVASASADGMSGKTVTAGGLRVSLPGADTELLVRGGWRIGIRVVAFGKQPRSRPSARITVTRTAPGEHPVEKVIARKTLRKGELRFPVTSAPGFAYRLQVQIGKRRWTTRLRTSNEVTTAVPSPTSADCRPSGTLVADSPSAAADGLVPFRLTNTSKSTLVHGIDVGWSQLTDGGWTPVVNPAPHRYFPGHPDPALATYTLAPGASLSSRSVVWASLLPGTYRMTLLVSCASKTPNGGIRFDATTLQSEPLTVTSAAGL